MLRRFFVTPADYRDHLQAVQWMLPEGRSVKDQDTSRTADMVDLLKAELEYRAKQKAQPSIHKLTSFYDL